MTFTVLMKAERRLIPLGRPLYLKTAAVFAVVLGAAMKLTSFAAQIKAGLHKNFDTTCSASVFPQDWARILVYGAAFGGLFNVYDLSIERGGDFR